MPRRRPADVRDLQHTVAITQVRQILQGVRRLGQDTAPQLRQWAKKRP